MSKYKMTVIMMTLLTISALGGVMFAHAQDENMVPAENMLSLLIDSESEVTFLFESIVNGDGIVPEDAQEAFEEAQLLRSEAQGLFDGASYEECLEKATEALNKYGEAFDKATVIEPLTLDFEELEAEAEKMGGLFTAIAKSRSRISTLLDIADNLEGQDVDTVDAHALLASASEILDEIQASLGSGDFDEQEIVLGEANSLIGQATGLLKNKGEPKKQEKIQHFIAQTRRRVGQLNKKMVRIFNHRGVSNTDELSGEFAGIIEGLDELDSKDGLKEVMAQLKTLVKNTKKVGKNKEGEETFFDDETVDAINVQTKMEARIERYRNRLLELVGNEELKLELEILLSEADDLLDQAEVAIGLEDEDLAEELTDAVEDILDEFDEMFDEVEEKSKGKGKSGDKFEDRLVEINEKIVELESYIAGIEDENERASFVDRLDGVKARRDEAVSDEDLDEVEELVEQLEEELGFETTLGKDKVKKDKEEKNKDLDDPEDSED
jgi:phage shock protein A